MEKSKVTGQAALWNLVETLKAWNALMDEQARLTTHIVDVIRQQAAAPKAYPAAAGS